MKGLVYIGKDLIGHSDLRIIDESMGVISGELETTTLYHQYQFKIQEHCNEKGISNSQDFPYRMLMNEKELQPEGGIGITDIPGLAEISVEAGGLDLDTMEILRQEAAG